MTICKLTSMEKSTQKTLLMNDIGALEKELGCD